MKIKSDYKDEIKSKLSSQYKSGYLGMNIEDMIKPCRNTIGVKMMKKMGWREGQGVGPKIKRKLRRLKKKVGSGKFLLAYLARCMSRNMSIS